MLTRLALILLLVVAPLATAAEEALYPGPMPPPGMLGFMYRAEKDGLKVISLHTDLPADRAGVRVGDLVLGEVDPMRPDSTRPLGVHAEGEKVVLRVRRGQDVMTFTLVLVAVPPDLGASLERRAVTAGGVRGRVERLVSGKAGVVLSAPTAVRAAEYGGEVKKDGSKEGNGRVVGSHDAWRVVVDGAKDLQVGDLVLVPLSEPEEAVYTGVPPGGAGWDARPERAAEPERPRSTSPPRRRLRVPRLVMDNHLKIVQANYAALIRAVPAEHQAVARSVRLVVLDDAGLNAKAYWDRGKRVIGVTKGMAETLMVLGYLLTAAPERSLDDTMEEINRLALAKGIGMEQTPLPAGMLQKMRDTRFAGQVAETTASMYAFVLGHELGHHCLGHLSEQTLSSSALVRDGLLALQESREMEKDADLFGAHAVRWSGRGPQPVLLFARFMALADTHGGGDFAPEYLKDHPEWTNRANYLEGAFSALGGQ